MGGGRGLGGGGGSSALGGCICWEWHVGCFLEALCVCGWVGGFEWVSVFIFVRVNMSLRHDAAHHTLSHSTTAEVYTIPHAHACKEKKTPCIIYTIHTHHIYHTHTHHVQYTSTLQIHTTRYTRTCPCNAQSSSHSTRKHVTPHLPAASYLVPLARGTSRWVLRLLKASVHVPPNSCTKRLISPRYE